MRLPEFLAVLVVLAVVVWVISAPLRAERGGHRPDGPEPTADVADLRAAKEAKYRELRDAELDFRTGKLSDEDYRATERALRAEAMAILRRLDAARAADREPGDGAG